MQSGCSHLNGRIGAAERVLTLFSSDEDMGEVCFSEETAVDSFYF